MARHPRLFIPGATCHVYCRVARGEFAFDVDLHFAARLNSLGSAIPRR